MDGGNAVSFLLNGLPPNGGTIYNQKFFETIQYPPGPHTIVVTYLGNSQTTPLTLDYIVVQNGTFPTPSGATTSTGQTSGSLPTTGSGSGLDKSGTSKSKSNNIGAIVGGVVGGLVLIALALLAFLYLRRREKRLKNNHINIEPQPYQYTPVAQPSPQNGQTHNPNNSYIGTGATAGSSHHPQMPSMTSTELHSGVTLPTTSSGMYTSGAASLAQGSDRLVPLRNVTPTVNNYPSSMSEKARREEEATVAAFHPSSRGRINPTSPGSDTSASSGVIRHEDSGLRLPQRATIDEIPPLYTAA